MLDKEIEKAIDKIYTTENKPIIKSELDKNNFSNLLRTEEDDEEEPAVCLTYSNSKSIHDMGRSLIKKNLLPISIKEKRQTLSREKSVDSPSTREFTLDSAKNVKNITPEANLTKNTSELSRGPSRLSSKNKQPESRGNSNNKMTNLEKHKTENLTNSSSKIINFNFLKNQPDFSNLTGNTYLSNPNHNYINRNKGINVFNTNPEKNNNHEKKNSTHTAYSAIAITNKYQNYPIYLKTDRDIQLKKERSSNTIFTDSKMRSTNQLMSPRRKLNSNSSKPGVIEDKLPTEREKERINSNNSQNSNNKISASNNYRKLNTDRGGSADKLNFIRDPSFAKPPEYLLSDRSKPRSQIKNRGQDLRFKIDEGSSSFIPLENNQNKLDVLPAISTNRKKMKIEDVDYDISSVIKKANDFKEDPIVQKKMEDIIQNIDDIRNVIRQKAKNRMKISSAPISHINQKYSFKGNPAYSNNDTNLVKNNLKNGVEDIQMNKLNSENKVRMVSGNFKKVPVKLKSMQV